MIMQFDMATGESTEAYSDVDCAPTQTRETGELALRLQHVSETQWHEQRIAAVAPAVLMLPIDLLIG